MATFPVTAPTRLLEAPADSEDVAAEGILEEEVKNATNVERSDTLLVTVLKVVLEVTVVGFSRVAATVEGTAVAVAEGLGARPASLAEDTVTCRAIALKARSATTVSPSI